MNWLKQIRRRICEWAGCHNLEARIEQPERRVASIPAAGSDKRTLRANVLKARAKELLDEGLSQSETAHRLGVSRQHISRLVRKGL